MMDGWIDGWMDGWIDIQFNRQIVLKSNDEIPVKPRGKIGIGWINSNTQIYRLTISFKTPFGCHEFEFNQKYKT